MFQKKVITSVVLLKWITNTHIHYRRVEEDGKVSAVCIYRMKKDIEALFDQTKLEYTYQAYETTGNLFGGKLYPVELPLPDAALPLPRPGTSV